MKACWHPFGKRAVNRENLKSEQGKETIPGLRNRAGERCGSRAKTE